MPFFPFLSIISRFGLYLFFLFSFFEERFGLYLIVECEDRSLYAVLVGKRADFFWGMLAERESERERERGGHVRQCVIRWYYPLIYQTLILKVKPNTRNVNSTMVIAHYPTRATVHTTNVDIF